MEGKAALPSFVTRYNLVAQFVGQRSPTTAAMLKYFTVVDIEGTAEQSIIIIQALKEGHYNYVHENDRSKDIDWAFTAVIGQNCRVRLLPPESPLD